MCSTMMNITNQETIKPSSPTPPHLNLYHLSSIDNSIFNHHLPFVFFYKNYNKGDINKLKKSLSTCLTQYYPFAGRLLSPSASHIECNDEGVEFLEASIDVPLQEFILKRDPDETILNKLLPNSFLFKSSNYNNRMFEVQVNHFSCGGAAVAVSISHKIADGFTMTSLVNHWATVTRGESPINPTFVSNSPIITSSTIIEDQFVRKKLITTSVVKKRFVFSNSKLSDLKNMINNMGSSSSSTPLNPSRVESLTALLFKCAVNAATIKAGGSFHPSNLSLAVNMRDKVVSTLSHKDSAVSNIISFAIANMTSFGELQLNEVITSLRKARLEIQEADVKDIEELGEMFSKKRADLRQGFIQTYHFTSLCNFPIYQVDFGWGNPVRVIFNNNQREGVFVFMDNSASGDGIEAIVTLKEEEMILFQNDKEFLAFVQD